MPNRLFQFENMEANNTICLLLSKEKIQGQIKNLNNHKAPGEDGILGELLKNRGKNLFNYVVGLIKKIWKNK